MSARRKEGEEGTEKMSDERRGEDSDQSKGYLKMINETRDGTHRKWISQRDF